MDSNITLMDLVEPILSEHYNGRIGSVDVSTLRHSGTGYLYASLNDDFTIVRLMYNEKCVGYVIQIYEYSTKTQRRSALLFSYRPDKLGFNFDGPKEFYYNCYIDSSSVPEVIKNFKQLITTGSVDITNTSWDLCDKLVCSKLVCSKLVCGKLFYKIKKSIILCYVNIVNLKIHQYFLVLFF